MSTASPTTLVNPVKERMRSGGVALGLSVRLARSGDIVRIAKTTGHDFVFVDAQHSLFSLETIGAIAQVGLSIGVATLVRVRSVYDPDTSLLLDNGVSGIVFPDVNTVEEARHAVAIAKFPPVGRRSVAGGYPQFDFRPMPTSEAVPQLNDSTLVVCMIETPEGLANCEDIAAVDGVDVLHVGANDLLANMGKPGKFGDPEIMAAIDRVIAAATAKGKFGGFGGDRHVERQVGFIRKGARFLTTQTDIGFLVAEAGRVAGELRRAIG